MNIAFNGRSVLIAAMAACIAGVASGQQPPTLQEGFVDVPGAKIYYQDSGGRGAPIIFLHAFTGSAEVWEQQIPAFTRAGYRFIAYERRGFGRTVADAKGPASTGPDDLLALVDHLKIDKFHLVGTAGGGFVALDFVLSYPQRVRSFTLLCSQGGVQDEEYRAALKRLAPRRSWTKRRRVFANFHRRIALRIRRAWSVGPHSKAGVALRKRYEVPPSPPGTGSLWRYWNPSRFPRW